MVLSMLSSACGTDLPGFPLTNRWLLARAARVSALWLACLVVLWVPAQGRATQADDMAGIQAQIQRDGQSRVLVEYRDSAFEPGFRRKARAARNPGRAARTRDRIERKLSRRARQRIRRFQHLPMLALDVDAQDLAKLAADPNVIAVTPDRLHAPSLVQSIPQLGADLTSAAGFGGNQVAIAILDTGIDLSHPNFAGRIVEEACFSAGGDCPGGWMSLIGPGAGANCSYSVDCFHGTHVAGIAGGAHATYQGVSPDADLVAVQIFSEFSGSACGSAPSPCPLAFTSDIIAGLLHVRSLSTVEVAAANLSLGGGNFTTQADCEAADPALAAEIAAVRGAGIAPVVSSGNDSYTNAMNSPACMGLAISVGSVSDLDQVASDSNSAPFLSFLATGVGITSSIPPSLFGGAEYGSSSGTSMAAPHVAGAFASLRSAEPTLTVTEMLDALTNTGIMVNDPKSGITTARIQIDAALQSLDLHDCFNGQDDDGDGLTDFPADPGCAHGSWIEAPACEDQIDNDGDGRIDFAGGPLGEPADPHCASPSDPKESANTGCGLGGQAAVIPPILAIWRVRRRSGA